MKEDGTLLHSISASQFPAKKKHIVKLQIGWVREGTDCWQQSNSLLKGFPLFTAQHQLQKRRSFVIRKMSQWRFCDWVKYPVWKLACLCVDRLIMICALVSPRPISVVLLDTTSVLGELGWKTYPINGVRRTSLDFFPFILSTVTF